MGTNGSQMAVPPYLEWDLLDISNSGANCMSIVGYDIYFRNMRIDLDKKAQ